MTFEGGADGGVVGAAEDDGDLTRGEPPGHTQFGCSQGGAEGGHFLAEDGGTSGDSAAGGADLSCGGFQVQGKADGGDVKAVVEELVK